MRLWVQGFLALPNQFSSSFLENGYVVIPGILTTFQINTLLNKADELKREWDGRAVSGQTIQEGWHLPDNLYFIPSNGITGRDIVSQQTISSFLIEAGYQKYRILHQQYII